MRAVLRSWAFLLLILATPNAQQKPDFSGHWVLINSESFAPDVARELNVRQFVNDRTAYGTPIAPFFAEISVERVFTADVRSRTYQIGIDGGTVSGTRGGETSETRQSVVWDGDKLVFEVSAYSRSSRESTQYVEHTEVWSLDGQGRLNVFFTDRRSGHAPRSTVLTYEKRGTTGGRL